jgi:hypothetical protein
MLPGSAPRGELPTRSAIRRCSLAFLELALIRCSHCSAIVWLSPVDPCCLWFRCVQLEGLRGATALSLDKCDKHAA